MSHHVVFIHISIHASREGSDHCRYDHRARAVKISIHASREGSDIPAQADIFSLQDFNPRFPRGKRRHTPVFRAVGATFQSTLPAREATFFRAMAVRRERNFNPRFPRGKRRPELFRPDFDIIFQSTLPAGEATISAENDFVLRRFQSTLPAGEATTGLSSRRMRRSNFNPRFPRGKRPRIMGVGDVIDIISIHASRGGSDDCKVYSVG